MSWSLRVIQKWLRETDFNLYQGIDLPYGLEVPGPRRDNTVNAAFGDLPIEGRSVWVIGSHYGCVPNILADRGAAGVLGWEARPEYAKIASDIAQIRETDDRISYQVANVELVPLPAAQFDYVTLFNVTHHLYYPAHTLAEIARRARTAFLIEWATLETYNARHDRKAPPGLVNWPVFLADKYGCWYGTDTALDAVLGRCGFKSVTHKPSPLGTHRRITACLR
jgi:2-polyprenyl-3-methyl-5-hydroxy-6-metoxy-1,4-benzoquinol methylase